MKSLFPAAAAAALIASAAFAQGAAVLTLNLDTASDQGQVLIAIFDSEEAFDRNGAPVRTVEASPGGQVRMEELAPGRYGIKAFHDLDGDGAMGRNPFGMPTEPYAFSGGAVPRMGPHSWSDAAFDLGASGAVQTLSFR